MAENEKTSAAQEFNEMLASAESQVDFRIDAAKLKLSEQSAMRWRIPASPEPNSPSASASAAPT